jgi:hypothetical protein
VHAAGVEGSLTRSSGSSINRPGARRPAARSTARSRARSAARPGR